MNTGFLAALPMAWDLTNFLTSATKTIKGWGSLIMILAGVILVIVAAVKIVVALINHGKTQTNWLVNIIMLVVGGVLGVGGWGLVSSIAGGGAQTIRDLGDDNGSGNDDSSQDTFSDKSTTEGGTIDFGSYIVRF